VPWVDFARGQRKDDVMQAEVDRPAGNTRMQPPSALTRDPCRRPR
jgi:hypothetical protein